MCIRDRVFRAGTQSSLMPLEDPIVLNTAAGPTKCSDQVSLSVPLLDEGQCGALVLSNTPS
eukprot:7071425-Prorocentrum_lima.AAC.1